MTISLHQTPARVAQKSHIYGRQTVPATESLPFLFSNMKKSQNEPISTSRYSPQPMF